MRRSGGFGGLQGELPHVEVVAVGEHARRSGGRRGSARSPCGSRSSRRGATSADGLARGRGTTRTRRRRAVREGGCRRHRLQPASAARAVGAASPGQAGPHRARREELVREGPRPTGRGPRGSSRRRRRRVSPRSGSGRPAGRTRLPSRGRTRGKSPRFAPPRTRASVHLERARRCGGGEVLEGHAGYACDDETQHHVARVAVGPARPRGEAALVSPRSSARTSSSRIWCSAVQVGARPFSASAIRSS